LAARSVSRTAPEVVLTATILIRFCVATDAIDAAWAGAGLVFDFCVSPFVVLSSHPLHSPEMAGQAAWQPDPDAFPVEVCPRSGSHHVMGPAVKA
jgi:hypothetical protein